ncbi:uncharacterized protein LOC108921898 [Scleropages formosus]|uniref:uncharacterized protein LOC108921898 n=1 Tax=Scleropages formosus TaxID=113540 RepID=UPI00087865F4|nr:uncharacterized protein LOC108921898 [Scleropages formosus]
MAFHHLRTLCQLLMIVLYADAVKAFSPVLQESVSNGAPDFSSLPSWGDGFLSSQFSDDALHSSAASPAESFFDLEDDESDNHDLGVVDEGDILDYNGLSPRAQRPPKGKRPKQKPVAGKPLPSTPQLREPLLESQRPHQTEDAGHPTQSREKGPSQRPTSPPGVDRPVPNISAPLKDPGTRNGQSPGDHHISTGIHRFPPVAKQPLSSWVPSRRKPAVYSPQSARRVPGFAQGSARRPSGFPEQNGLTSGIRRPPFSHFSDHVERPSVASDVTWGRADVAYSPYAPPSASRLPLSTYGTADRRGPRIGPYGLVHGDYGRPLEGMLSSDQYGPALHRHSRPSESYFPSSYNWALGHFIPSFQRSDYEVPLPSGFIYNGHIFPYGSFFPPSRHGLTRGQGAAYGSRQRGYFIPTPYRPEKEGFPPVLSPDYHHGGETASFHGGHYFPVHYGHGGHVVQSKTNLEHGRVQFSQTSYSPLAARPVLSHSTSGRGSHSDNRLQQSWNHHVPGRHRHGY